LLVYGADALQESQKRVLRIVFTAFFRNSSQQRYIIGDLPTGPDIGMQAYYINLDTRADRLAHMQSQCDALGFPAQRHAAVNAKDPEVIARAAACPPAPDGIRMSAGAYACLQSHRAVWRRMLDGTDSHIMVLEDDLLLGKGITQYLAEDWIPPAAGVIKLETYATRQHLAMAEMRPAGPRVIVPIRSYHVGGGCYILSRAAAEVLMRASDAPNLPVDELIFREAHLADAGLETWQMVPAPAIQGDRTQGLVAADWANTSITQHWDSSSPVSPDHPPLPLRIWTRATQELRARVMGTRYKVVPFG
jgi:glycosyl transferase, family 25